MLSHLLPALKFLHYYSSILINTLLTDVHPTTKSRRGSGCSQRLTMHEKRGIIRKESLATRVNSHAKERRETCAQECRTVTESWNWKQVQHNNQNHSSTPFPYFPSSKTSECKTITITYTHTNYLREWVGGCERKRICVGGGGSVWVFKETAGAGARQRANGPGPNIRYAWTTCTLKNTGSI